VLEMAGGPKGLEKADPVTRMTRDDVPDEASDMPAPSLRQCGM
jgi:hypothetical protein